VVTYILDSSAVLRYLDNDAGALRVAEIVKSHLAGRCEAVIAAPHWGEIAGILCKLRGRQAMENALSLLSSLGLGVVSADGDRCVRAALWRLRRGLSYVDAFGVALTAELEESVFVTADFDFKPAARDVTIEFLPVKQN
jgi:PIN domain nuclease of toxin-antitoxin system